MADTKTSALTALTGAGVAAGDVLPIADVSATTLKSIRADELAIAMQTLLAAASINGFSEAVQDVIGALASGGSAITMTYNDGANTWVLDAAVDGSTIEVASDALRIKEPRVVSIQVTDPAGSALTTGDGKAYFRVPSTLNGMNLVAVAAAVTTASSSGTPTVQIANVTQAADMLSTKLTIDANETDSSTAAAAAVIDGANDDVATGDLLRVDVDVAGTGTKGLIVELQFQAP